MVSDSFAIETDIEVYRFLDESWKLLASIGLGSGARASLARSSRVMRDALDVDRCARSAVVSASIVVSSLRVDFRTLGSTLVRELWTESLGW